MTSDNEAISAIKVPTLNGMMTLGELYGEKIVNEIAEAAIASQPRVTEAEARLVEAARVYYSLYMQDEADSADNCTCGEQQQRHAIAVRDALQPYLNVRES